MGTGPAPHFSHLSGLTIAPDATLLRSLHRAMYLSGGECAANVGAIELVTQQMPSSIAGYEVSRSLGVGVMGSVYLASGDGGVFHAIKGQ